MPFNSRSIFSLPRPIAETGPGFLAWLVIGLLLCASGARAASPQINELVVVKSSDNAYYNSTVATLAQMFKTGPLLRVLMADELSRELDDGTTQRVYIALGVEALGSIRTLKPDATVISAYLTHEQYLQQDPQRHFAVLLDQPLQRYLAFCKLILNLDSVGIILQDDILPGPGLRQTLGTMQLKLTQYRVNEKHKLLPVLRDLLNSNDALLMLPRQSIFNPDSLQAVLLTSYRKRKPAISYSPAHVRSGALASIYSSPLDIARHLAIVIRQRLAGTAAAAGFEHARFYTISRNRRVAQALDLSLPDDRQLRADLDRIPL